MRTLTHVPDLSMAGIRIHALKRVDLITVIEESRGSSEPRLILNHNLHSLYLYVTDRQFAASYEKANWVYVDGMPVVWLAQLAGVAVKAEHRITFLDCFDSILGDAVSYKWRVFYVGSSPRVIEEGLAQLRARYPELMIGGTDGFFEKSGPENDRIVGQINAFKPDVLFVGMGMPLQEKWIAANLPNLGAGAILTCGATLEYVTGHSYRPPAWAGPLGLYGVMRLLHDPKRLWRRYLVEPLRLAAWLLPRLLRQRLTRAAAVSVASESV